MGSLDDISFLPLSNNTKEAILQKLREGYGRRDVRTAIQRHFNERIRCLFPEAASSSSSSVYGVHRDQFVHSEDVYNIYKKVQELSYKKHNEQKESIKLWLKDHQQQRGYFTYIAQDLEQSYIFGFVSPWQRQQLVRAESFCLDATHCVSNIVNVILYRHSITGSGSPVSFFFTSDHSMIPIARFLRFIKNLGPDQQLPCLKKITIDVSAAEHAAITGVFGSTVSIQRRLFHVSRVWMDQIRKKVKLGSVSANNAAHRSMMAALKDLM